MRRALTWLAIVLTLGAMVALVVGAGWLAYTRVVSRLANPRASAPGAVPLTRSARDLRQDDSPPEGRERIVHTLLGLYLQVRADDLNTPTGEGEPVPFVVEAGETTAVVAMRLSEAGLVSDAELFRLYMRYRGVDRGLEAGSYELSPAMTIPEIAEALQQGRPEEIVVTIPEGWRMEQIAALLDQEAVMSGQEFLSLARDGDVAYPFLDDRPRGATLEGYLFPDTYRLPLGAEGLDLIQRMLENFDQRVTPQMRDDAAKQGFSLFQVVTLASIVEREGAVREELPLIASVYRNRLDQNMKLDADPTVQYALGYQADTGQWWKRPLLLEEYGQVDSPYNTYLNPGLPPGPICNPGLAAIRAVIYPTPSDYVYFVRNDVADDGSHVFARTFKEHQRNLQQYQQ